MYSPDWPQMEIRVSTFQKLSIQTCHPTQAAGLSYLILHC